MELSKSLFGEGTEACKTWTDERCHQLKHAGGAAVLQTLETLAESADEVRVRPSAKEQMDATLTYYRSHHLRMDYPRYLAAGWQIGSGPVESACKTVVGNRLKGGGMRWSVASSDAVCHLRALYLSEPSQWEAYWQNPA